MGSDARLQHFRRLALYLSSPVVVRRFRKDGATGNPSFVEGHLFSQGNKNDL